MRYLAAVALAALIAVPVMAADIVDTDRTATFDPQPPVEPWQRPVEVLWGDPMWGDVINSPGTGAGGCDESLLQTVLFMNILGFGHQFSLGFGIADDFDVTDAEWDIQDIHTLAYQTGSTTTSTITGLYATIYNGVPGAGGVPVCGNYTDNILVDSAFSCIYRATDTSSGATNRPLMVTDGVITDCCLPMGTYWVGWSVDGSLSSGPWVPPITINGQTTTGNGLQSTDGAFATWASADDSGTLTPQGIPFILTGERFCGPPVPTESRTWGSIKATFQE